MPKAINHPDFNVRITFGWCGTAEERGPTTKLLALNMNRPAIYAPNAIESALEMLNSFLDGRSKEGAVFKAGQTIQCLWMWFKIEELNDGLSVFSPKLGIMPMDFQRDCSDALNLILTQRYACDSFGVGCGWCNSLQSAIVIKDIDSCKEIFMSRSEEEDGRVSGWCFGAIDSKLDVNNPDNLELRSLWELFCQIPDSGDFSLLPVGWQVIFDKKPIVLKDSEMASVQSGSYYEAKYGS